MDNTHTLEIDSFYCDKQQHHFKEPYRIRLIRGPNFLVLEDPYLDLLISERTYRKARKVLNLAFAQLWSLSRQDDLKLSKHQLELKKKFRCLLLEIES